MKYSRGNLSNGHGDATSEDLPAGILVTLWFTGVMLLYSLQGLIERLAEWLVGL